MKLTTIFYILTVTILSTLLISCGGGDNDYAMESTSSSEYASLKISLGSTTRTTESLAKGTLGSTTVPDDITRCVVTCSGADMDDVGGELPLDGTPLILDGILPGTDRTVLIEAFNDQILRFSGSETIPNLEAGTTASVTVRVVDLGEIVVSVDPIIDFDSAVQANNVAVPPTISVQLYADVSHHDDTSVTWLVDGIEGGDVNSGTISVNGLYTAPATVGHHVVRAVSNEDPSLLIEVNMLVDFAIFEPTSLLDEVDANIGDGLCETASGDCTLRAAIQESNALAGPNSIILGAGTYTITIPNASGDEEQCETGDFDVLDDLTISGQGSGQTIVDANGLDRGFELSAVSVNFSDFAIINGANASYGAAFQSNGSPFVLDHMLFDSNTSINGGGAILMVGADANAVIRDSVFSNNSAGLGGGAIQFQNEGELLILRSTFSGNSCGSTYTYGAALFTNASSGTLRVYNSTFSDNSSNASGSQYGGVIGNNNIGHLEIWNSTITDNDTTGILNYWGSSEPVFLYNSIVANQRNGHGDCLSRSGTALISYIANPDIDFANNLSDGSCDTLGVLAGTDLESLADNGGPTLTHLPISGSPPVDTLDGGGQPIDCSGIEHLDTDQRGLPRNDGACDIGAVELQAGEK